MSAFLITAQDYVRNDDKPRGCDKSGPENIRTVFLIIIFHHQLFLISPLVLIGFL